jgi:hypothetical protein
VGQRRGRRSRGWPREGRGVAVRHGLAAGGRRRWEKKRRKRKEGKGRKRKEKEKKGKGKKEKGRKIGKR